jgi:ABC-type multidrug transport system ATPase subunit
LYIEWKTDDAQRRQLPVPDCGLIIGRDPNCPVSIGHEMVSWHHARVSLSQDQYVLTDLGSRNGTILNGSRMRPNEPIPLRTSDSFQVEGHVFTLVTSDRQNRAATESATRMISLNDLRGPGRILVGRSRDCDIVLDDPAVSWQHALITRQPHGWHVKDLDSSNGVFVNETRIKSASFSTDDRVRIGLHRFAIGEQNVTHIDDAGRVHIDVEDLSRTVWKSGQSLTLIDAVSLSIEPQELVAIAGGSGAGKTTLLLALCGYQPADRGRVLLNGVDFYTHRDLFRSAIGYVPQADIVHSDLTVESALRYAAQLRLPPDTTRREIDGLIVETMTALGLTDRRLHRIRTLSGGERKRVSIGVELLSRPSVLFLDEPTTGLDAGLERRITQQFRSLVDAGRTVIVVTHSVQTIEQYDKVIWMARGGMVAFYGAPPEALRYFEVRSYAEIYDLLNAPRELQSRPAGDASAGPRFAHRTPSGGAKAPATQRRCTGVNQLGPLIRRYLEVIRSDTRNLVFWLAQAPAIGLIITILFNADPFAPEQTPGEKGNLPIQDAPRLMFMVALSIICFGLCNACREIVKEKAIYHRERHVSLQIWPYLLSKVLILSLVALCQNIILMMIIGMKIDLGMDAPHIGWMLLVLFLGSVNAALIGLCVSAQASSTDQAITLVALILLLQVIFSGLIPLEQMNSVFQWITSLNAMRWTYGGLCGATDIPTHFTNTGLDMQVADVFRTGAPTAAAVLAAMAAAELVAVWIVLATRDKHRN